MKPPPGHEPASLWRHPDFLLLWAGQTVSDTGTYMGVLILPLMALALHGSVLVVGLLTVADTLPLIIVALPAGLLVDSVPRKPLMISCDVARMIIVGSVPLAYALGHLTIAQLYIVAIMTGTVSAVFDSAYQSYLPDLVRGSELLKANSKLGATAGLASVVGQATGGALYGALRAGSVTVDAASYLVSWIALLLIRAKEQAAGARHSESTARRAMREEVTAGVTYVFADQVLRALAIFSALANLCVTMVTALLVIFMIDVLHLRAIYTGPILAAIGAGLICGGLSAPWLSRRLGSARIIWLAVIIPGALFVPAGLSQPGWTLALLPTGLFSLGASIAVFQAGQTTYRQTVCPPQLLGRVNAATRWIARCTFPVAGLLAGVLGESLGVRVALLIGLGGAWASGVILIRSPLGTMRQIPAPAQTGITDVSREAATAD